jgi:hypothetical protein
MHACARTDTLVFCIDMMHACLQTLKHLCGLANNAILTASLTHFCSLWQGKQLRIRLSSNDQQFSPNDAAFAVYQVHLIGALMLAYVMQMLGSV